MEDWVQPPVEWKQIVSTEMDDYRDAISHIDGVDEKTMIAHAMQKDAIQNSLDALDPTSRDEWGCIIEVENIANPGFIAITDYGTTGLTGQAIVSTESLNSMSP